MAASVRIEDEAFSDLRFRHLGNLLGTSEFDALGRMAHLWRACTARMSYSLPREMVRAIVDPVALVAADLAEEGDEMRIKGTEGRIEWLFEKRKASKKGGLATRAKWRGNRPAQPRAERRPKAGPPAPAPAPAQEIPEQASPATTSLEAEEQNAEPKLKAKRKRKAQPPAPRSASAPAPLPFTAKELGQAFARGAGAAFALDSWDAGLAAPVTRVIRSLAEAGRSLADVEAAGKVVSGWRLPEALTWGWLAKAGALAGAVAKARNGVTHAAAKAVNFEEW